MSTPEKMRLMDLLADRAITKLSVAEETELAELLAIHPEVDVNSLDEVAALIASESMPNAGEDMPEELRRRIEAQAKLLVPANRQIHRDSLNRMASNRGTWLAPGISWAGWVLAAGLLIGFAYLWGNKPADKTTPAPSAAEKFARFLATDAYLRIDGAAPDGKIAPGAQASIYWSGGQRQEGYMKLQGLPVNDPSHQQYQLWIFDRERDQRYPVDGGVFNVPVPGEVVVPITAKIPVKEATLFVVTREPPGGVVVSDRKEIVLVAAVK